MELKVGDMVKLKGQPGYSFKVVLVSQAGNIEVVATRGAGIVGGHFHFFADDLVPDKPKCLTE